MDKQRKKLFQLQRVEFIPYYIIILNVSYLIIFVLSKVVVLNDLERLLQVTQRIHQRL